MDKKCSRCNEIKDMLSFGERGGKRKDRKSYCKKCENEYKKEIYRKSNTLSKPNHLDGEIWKHIPGFRDYYMISNLGRIKSNYRISEAGKIVQERIRYTKPGFFGYLSISLIFEGKTKTCSVHRLVATSFIPNPENLKEINHKNGIKTDNRVDNLEWCTRSHNMQHAWDTGLKNAVGGEESRLSKLKVEQVIEIKNLINSGNSNYKIAKLFGVNRSTIRMIKIGKSWKNI